MLRFFARRLRDAQNEEKGFTLIELLVVIIIIGILAAIAIPTFLAQRQKAWNAAAQSELRNMAAAATSCSVNNGGAFDAPTDCGDDAVGGALTQAGWSDDENVTQTAVGTATQWDGSAVHVNGGCNYTFTTDAGDQNAGQVVPDGVDASCENFVAP